MLLLVCILNKYTTNTYSFNMCFLFLKLLLLRTVDLHSFVYLFVWLPGKVWLSTVKMMYWTFYLSAEKYVYRNANRHRNEYRLKSMFKEMNTDIKTYISMFKQRDITWKYCVVKSQTKFPLQLLCILYYIYLNNIRPDLMHMSTVE